MAVAGLNQSSTFLSRHEMEAPNRRWIRHWFLVRFWLENWGPEKKRIPKSTINPKKKMQKTCLWRRYLDCLLLPSISFDMSSRKIVLWSYSERILIGQQIWESILAFLKWVWYLLFFPVSADITQLPQFLKLNRDWIGNGTIHFLHDSSPWVPWDHWEFLKRRDASKNKSQCQSQGLLCSVIVDITFASCFQIKKHGSVINLGRKISLKGVTNCIWNFIVSTCLLGIALKIK